MDKYIFKDGVMQLNPQWVEPAPAVAVVAAPRVGLQPPPPVALAFVSNTNDIMHAQAAAQRQAQSMMLTPTTEQPIQVMQSQAFANQFGMQQGHPILEGLTTMLAHYEIPAGMLQKLQDLARYNLNFMIDDSHSMENVSDVFMRNLHPATIPNFNNRCVNKRVQQLANTRLTRWEEAENRLHIMIDILQFLPILNLTISFMNSSAVFTTTHAGKTPEQFAAEMHHNVQRLFSKMQGGNTPTLATLKKAFDSNRTYTMHYLFTDGEPSEVNGKALVKQLVVNRPNPEMNPLTFITCTNDDAQAEFMKDIEGEALYCSEIDDYEDERRGVIGGIDPDTKKQEVGAHGPALPFNYGIWLVANLVAAINPDDLDMLDEPVPFTKRTLDMTYGRRHTMEEYIQYFKNNVHADREFRHLFQQFSQETLVASQIVPNHRAFIKRRNFVFQQPPMPEYVRIGLQPPPQQAPVMAAPMPQQNYYSSQPQQPVQQAANPYPPPPGFFSQQWQQQPPATQPPARQPPQYQGPRY